MLNSTATSAKNPRATDAQNQRSSEEPSLSDLPSYFPEVSSGRAGPLSSGDFSSSDPGGPFSAGVFFGAGSSSAPSLPPSDFTFSPGQSSIRASTPGRSLKRDSLASTRRRQPVRQARMTQMTTVTIVITGK